MALGSYPAVGLKAARKARDTAKLQKAEGTDPVQARKVEKLKSARPGGDTFQAVALSGTPSKPRNGAPATQSVHCASWSVTYFPGLDRAICPRYTRWKCWRRCKKLNNAVQLKPLTAC